MQHNCKRPDRRNFLEATGLAIVGTSLLGGNLFNAKAFAAEPAVDTPVTDFDAPGVVVVREYGKPVYLPAEGSKDPAIHSLADTLFWADIMMEHAMFFTLLMPGKDLTQQRMTAMAYQDRFTRYLSWVRRMPFNSRTFRDINLRTIAQVRPFLNFKLRMLELQTTGKMHSLVWPLFFEHTAREAKRFIARLELFNSGVVEFHRNEVVDFWSATMGEHAQFVAHLLDPQEVALIKKADRTAQLFLNRLRSRPQDYNALLNAGEEIIDFKTAAAKGIETGQIKSIIHPALADHVRREAVKYVDELKRT
jgi:hypothetical protein